ARRHGAASAAGCVGDAPARRHRLSPGGPRPGGAAAVRVRLQPRPLPPSGARLPRRGPLAAGERSARADEPTPKARNLVYAIATGPRPASRGAGPIVRAVAWRASTRVSAGMRTRSAV